MDVIIQNLWFTIWKTRKKQNKNDEKGKIKNLNDKNSISFSKILEVEMEKYKVNK